MAILLPHPIENLLIRMPRERDVIYNPQNHCYFPKFALHYIPWRVVHKERINTSSNDIVKNLIARADREAKGQI